MHTSGNPPLLRHTGPSIFDGVIAEPASDGTTGNALPFSRSWHSHTHPHLGGCRIPVASHQRQPSPRGRCQARAIFLGAPTALRLMCTRKVRGPQTGTHAHTHTLTEGPYAARVRALPTNSIAAEAPCTCVLLVRVVVSITPTHTSPHAHARAARAHCALPTRPPHHFGILYHCHPRRIP